MAELEKVTFTHMETRSDQRMQIPVKTDIIVPDTKPDIGRIIKTRILLDPGEKTLDHSRMHWNGKLLCYILYAGEEDAKELYSMEYVLNMDEFMNLELPEGEGRIRYTFHGEVMEMKAAILNSRKVNLQAVIHLVVDVTRHNEYEVIRQMQGVSHLQVRKKELPIVSLKVDREEKYMVKEEIAVPAAAPDIQEIVWWETSVARSELHLMDGKASVRGDLLMHILYRGENAEEPVQYMEGCIPFQGLMDSTDIDADAPGKVHMSPSAITVRAAADADGAPRAVLVEAMMDCRIQVYEKQNLTSIEDLYAPGWNLIPQWTQSEAQQFVLQEDAVQRIQERVSVPETYPEVQQILGAAAQPQVDDYYTVDGTLHADGVLKVQIFYVTADERYPIAVLQEMLPFSAVIHGIPDEEISVDLLPVLLHVRAEYSNSREIQIHADIRLDILVMKVCAVPLMTDAELQPKDPAALDSMPALTVYVVQPGEDLWQIAKAYDTTPERIAMWNHLEDEKNLQAGKQLLLVKEV